MAEHNFTVATRVRPMDQREKDCGSVRCVEVEGKKIVLHSQDAACKKMEFTYDQSYWSCNSNDAHFVGQARLFEDIGESVVQCAAEGYNSCVFAYGQTGSGKTHTMMGSDAEPGLVPRICRALMDLVERGTERGVTHRQQDSWEVVELCSYLCRFMLSYLEIYNEKIRDLLYDPQSETTSGYSGKRNSLTEAKNSFLPHQHYNKLRIRRSKAKGIHIPDLTQVLVASYEEVEELLRVGNARRSTAGTRVNAQSSRSHAVLTLTCSQAQLTHDVPSEIGCKLHLVDLAGSERVKVTGASGARLTEGRHINRSLSALSKVLYTLSEGGKAAAHVPYRDSLLTQLLQDSLGGNSKTFMIATISPSSLNYKESLGTLRYASCAKRIVNTPTINEDPNVKTIRELRGQIQSLEMELLLVKGIQEAPETEDELTQKQQQEKKLTRRWHRRWAGGDQEDTVDEAPGLFLELPSPIMEVSRVVKRLQYPEPTDSGVNSPRDTDDEDEYLDDSDASFHSTGCHSSFCSELHDNDDDGTTPSPPSSPSSSSTRSVKSASGETGTEPTTWFDRHSTPTQADRAAARPRPSLPGTSQNRTNSICTQTSFEDDHNESAGTRALDELVHNFSLLENGIDYDVTDVSSATDMSNITLMVPGNASSRKLAVMLEKEVERRLYMSFANSSINNSLQLPFSSTLATSPSPTFPSSPPTSVASSPPTSVASIPPTSIASIPPTSVASTQPTSQSTFPAFNSGLASLASACIVSSAVPATRSRPRPLTIDLSLGYSVDVSSVFRLKGAPSSARYYQVDLRAGSECWKVYKKFSDVVVMKTDLGEKYPALRPVMQQHEAIFSRHVEDFKNQPSKQELKMFLCDVLALLTLPTSSWSPLNRGPPSQFELRGLHSIFRVGLSDGLRSIIHNITGTVPVDENL